jgi:molybdopterin molybdotransferase
MLYSDRNEERCGPMRDPEIDEGAGYIGFDDALHMILASTSPVETAALSLAYCTGYISANNVFAAVNSPTDNVSLKDGFAVKAQDVEKASPRLPTKLKVVGSVFAGGNFKGRLADGQAVQVCSGSPIPAGADAVVSAEFCEEVDSEVYIKAGVKKGRNIFYAGDDVRAGALVLEKGELILPARLGLIAAAGISHLQVFRKPRVCLIAIGDEVVALGQTLKEGQLYASNLVSTEAWLSCFGIPSTTAMATDAIDSIKSELLGAYPEVDAIITSGGSWRSERDLIVRVLDGLGWRKIFHHVRMGPGKGMAFGIWRDKPVFCLPGGPPSNEMAFLQLALPGILNMSGLTGSPLRTVSAELTQDVKGRHRAWTEFKKVKLNCDDNGAYSVTPYLETSRLKSMADSSGLVCKPEGVDSLYRGRIVEVQVMIPSFAAIPIPLT